MYAFQTILKCFWEAKYPNDFYRSEVSKWFRSEISEWNFVLESNHDYNIQWKIGSANYCASVVIQKSSFFIFYRWNNLKIVDKLKL